VSIRIPVIGGVVAVNATGDVAIAAVAAEQRGVVSHAQMKAAGLGRGAMAHRVANGRLHRLHRGVYLVGHAAPAPLARETGALLACGPGAVLSHRTAAGLWGLMPPSSGLVDVTVPGRDCGSRAGVRVHKAGEVLEENVGRRERLPVTAPALTVLDMARTLDADALERCVNEALVLKLVDHPELRSLAERFKRRTGSAALRRLLDRLEGPNLTRSEAEQRFLSLLVSAKLPRPSTNAKVGGFEVDFLWRRQRLVVEVDGFAFHSSRTAFERDRARDAELQAGGFRVVRVTWRQIVDEPEATVATLAGLLAY
jgi:very-short-patch-repair endonuclease